MLLIYNPCVFSDFSGVTVTLFCGKMVNARVSMHCNACVCIYACVCMCVSRVMAPGFCQNPDSQEPGQGNTILRLDSM